MRAGATKKLVLLYLAGLLACAGQRFLMVKDEAPDTAVSKQIVVVLNWAEEVNRLSKV